MNLYIESIEGGDYLVATGDTESRTVLMDASARPRKFHCLSEIKAHFHNQPFHQVWLKQTTPYEEMVGQPASTSTLELEIAWH
ncbi:DUF6482 family protein [Alteromonas sp. CYL-A6]|uniref:DUF6482 family protein n=1 Tax=Alteromonas nitratireducens TaxID=3390813 RepID=UPI0034B3BA40